MMENEINGRKKDLKILLIVILTIIVIMLGGYLVYDKVLKKDNVPTNNDNGNNAVEKDNNSATPSNNSTKNYIEDFSLLPKQSDNSANEIGFDITNENEYFTTSELSSETIKKSTTSNGFTINFSGKNDIMGSGELAEKCHTIDAIIDDKISIIPYDTCDGGSSVSYKIIKTNKYYIFGMEYGDDGSGEIIIYDLNGQEVYSIDESFMAYSIVVVDNVLYFNASTYPTYWQSYIDLSLDGFNVVKVKELSSNQ